MKDDSDHSADGDAGRETRPQLVGDYELVRELGRGGMGVVYEARHRVRRTTVALKRLISVSPGAIENLKREFRALEELSHPNLIRLVDLAVDVSPPFFTMELIEGVDFLNYVQAGFDSRASHPDTRHHPGRLSHAMRQAASGILALHRRGRLHRDIKPSNVLVRSDGRLVLVDFGLAVDVDPEADVYRNSLRDCSGTAFYMSPEQHAGRPLSFSSDWYSLGVLLFEALTGQLPFQGKSLRELQAEKLADARPGPRDVAPDVPDHLDRLCRELLDPQPDCRPSGEDVLSRLGSGPPPPAIKRSWVGRKEPLKRLDRALDEVRRGRPASVLLSGPPGTGKSALVDRFLESVGARGRYVVLRGKCYENESVPYKGFDMVVAALARYLRREPLAKVEALLPLDLTALCQIFPVLKEIPAIRFAATPVDQSHPDARELRRRGVAALRETLIRLCRREELIIYVDDLQWGDHDTAFLFQELARLPGAVRCLTIGAFRDGEEPQASPCVAAVRRQEQPAGHRKEFARQVELRVGPLEPNEAYQLALDLIGGAHGQARTVARAIADESRGNPFFVTLLAEEQVAHRWRDTSGHHHLTLDGVLWRKIRDLPPEQRAFVELTAIAGRPVDGDLIYQGCQAVEDPALLLRDVSLAKLVRIVGGGGRGHVEPYHDCVREAVWNHLDGAATCRAAERLAEVLIARGEASDPEFIAMLLDRALRPREAGRFYWQAAERSAEQLAFTQAVQLYRQAIAGLQPEGEDALRLRVGLADALAHAGRGAEAAAEYLWAAERAGDPRRLDWLCQAARRYLTSGHIDEGLDALQQVLAAVGMGLPRSPQSALLRLAWYRAAIWWRGLHYVPVAAESLSDRQRQLLDYSWSAAAGLSVVDPVKASVYVCRNLRLALQAGETVYLTRALAAQIGHVAIAGNRSRKQVADYLRAGRRVVRDEGGPYARGARDLARGVAAHLRGRWEPAHRCCDRAVSYLMRCQDVMWELDTARTFGMWALMYIGDIETLTRRQPDLLLRAVEHDDLFAMLNFGSVVRTYVQLGADQVAEARDRLDDERGLLSDRGFFVQHHNWLLARTFLELYEGRASQAWGVIVEGWPNYKQSFLGWVEQVRIDFLQVQGRAAVAAAADPAASVGPSPARRVIRRLRREKAPWARAVAELLAGGLATVEQDRDRAVRHLEQAADGLAAADMRLHAAAAHLRLATLRDGDGGRRHAERGAGMMRRLGVANFQRMTNAMAPGVFQGATLGS